MGNLSDWLDFIQKQNAKNIDLNLDRVSFVAKKLAILPFSCFVVIVGGTNGKGSTVAGLESIWSAAGFKVGCFTSPWLFKYNEIIRICGKNPSDKEYISAFEKIESVRNGVNLTMFEFNTLTSLMILSSAVLDVVILEVGLGGRLDAVNIVTPDISVITSIGIDHTEWLGDTRDAIAYEKAGIFRPGVPAVCGDIDPPMSLKKPGVPLFIQGSDFGFVENISSWDFWSFDFHLSKLPRTKLLLQNMATVLQVVQLCKAKFPVSKENIDLGLSSVSLKGRIELRNEGREIYDVAHNLAATKPLLSYLRSNAIDGKTWAVFSMLAEKDILGVIQAMKFKIDKWVIAPLKNARGASMARLMDDFMAAGICDVENFISITDAHAYVKSKLTKKDRMVVFGSFYLLAELDY